MGMRPGRAKGPYVGAPGGIIPPGTISSVVPRWLNFPILATDFTAAAFSESITVWTMPAGTYIQTAFLFTSAAFTLAGLTGYHIEIGITGDLNRYCNLYNVRLPPAGTNFSLNAGPWLENKTIGTAIKATAISTGKHLNLVSTGTAQLHLLVSNIFGTVIP